MTDRPAPLRDDSPAPSDRFMMEDLYSFGDLDYVRKDSQSSPQDTDFLVSAGILPPMEVSEPPPPPGEPPVQPPGDDIPPGDDPLPDPAPGDDPLPPPVVPPGDDLLPDPAPGDDPLPPPAVPPGDDPIPDPAPGDDPVPDPLPAPLPDPVPPSNQHPGIWNDPEKGRTDTQAMPLRRGDSGPPEDPYRDSPGDDQPIPPSLQDWGQLDPHPFNQFFPRIAE